MHIKSLFTNQTAKSYSCWLLIRVEVEFLTNSQVSPTKRAQGYSQNFEESITDNYRVSFSEDKIQKRCPAYIGTLRNVFLLSSCFGKS